MCVMQADQFEGPYEYVEKFYRPLQMSTGDFDIYKDDSTGKAYLIFDPGFKHFLRLPKFRNPLFKPFAAYSFVNFFSFLCCMVLYFML